MTNRKKRAPLIGLAVIALTLSMTGVVSAANADDVSGSEAISVETTKEAPIEAPVEETKKAEEPPAPVKEAPAAPVAPVVPDPVVVAPAPPVEQPAPAPVVPESVVVPVPAVPAAPVAPQVETPAAPELPAAQAKDVVIDDPAPAVVAPVAEEEVPPVCEPSWTVQVETVADEATLPGWGTLFTSGTIECGVPGASYGDYSFVLTNASFWPGMGTTWQVGPLKTTSGAYFDGDNVFWSCAKQGATFTLIDNTTGLPVVGPSPLPGGVDPNCGTTGPVQQIVPVHVPELTIVPAGENQPGSITPKEPVVGATLSCDPAGAIQGWVTCEWVLVPETSEVKYVFAEGDGKLDPINLGEYSESVPNPGIYPAYSGHSLTEQGVGTLTPLAPFNQKDSVGLSLSGTSKVDGSIVNVAPVFQDTLGLAPVVVQVDLSQFCGLVKYFWMTQTTTSSSSSQAILFPGAVTLPACDPQGGDDGGDNENPNPNPNPNPDPSHPGHGHGHGDDDGDHGGHDGCISQNHHSCEPGNNGPVGTPGDLNSGGVEADASANNVVVQSSTVEELGMGNAIPEESDLSNVNSSNEDELAYTGSDDPLRWTVIGLGLFAMGLVLFAWMRPRKRK